ncbi:FAD-dependent oxidoreductase [Streptomyces sp. NBC_00988]|uniref:FAD-binding oxidoreductase n=1 Tax=Streptomyces sp. NBC_00988 TaxID=2903704 RepID=UPI003865830E|nr:FAD-dependent oxidoreductase [Streptomyces sp. NBC_00988]
MVLLPETDAEVAETVQYAAGTLLPISVRSGGHGLSGRSSNDGGVVIDLSSMHEVELIDPATRLVRVQAGARWANVARALGRSALAISSGDHGNVGVGGLATAGGVGWFARLYGLTIDHVRAARVVLADGSVVRADSDAHPDLFWALRGAGDIGIVTEFEIEAARLSSIGVGEVAVEADREGGTLRRWSEYMSAAPRDLTTNGLLVRDGTRFVLQLTAVVADGDLGRARTVAAELARLGVRPFGSRARTASYESMVPTAHLHDNTGQQPSQSTNALLPTLTPSAARALMDVAASPGGALVQLRSLGGAINDIDPGANAYSHRHQQVLAIISVFPHLGGVDLDTVAAPVRAFADGAYRSFDSRPDQAAFARAFPGATGDRVRALQHQYDPDRVFHRAGPAAG